MACAGILPVFDALVGVAADLLPPDVALFVDVDPAAGGVAAGAELEPPLPDCCAAAGPAIKAATKTAAAHVLSI
jgi:hypothetical protein